MTIDPTDKTGIDLLQKTFLDWLYPQRTPRTRIRLFFYNLHNKLKKIFRRKINLVVNYPDGKKRILKDLRPVRFGPLEPVGQASFSCTVSFSYSPAPELISVEGSFLEKNIPEKNINEKCS